MGMNITSNIVHKWYFIGILCFTTSKYTIQLCVNYEHTLYDIFKGSENTDSPTLNLVNWFSLIMLSFRDESEENVNLPPSVYPLWQHTFLRSRSLD